MVLHLHNDYLNVDTKLGKKIKENYDYIYANSKYIKIELMKYKELKLKLRFYIMELTLRDLAQDITTKEMKEKNWDLVNRISFFVCWKSCSRKRCNGINRGI